MSMGSRSIENSPSRGKLSASETALVTIPMVAQRNMEILGQHLLRIPKGIRHGRCRETHRIDDRSSILCPAAYPRECRSGSGKGRFPGNGCRHFSSETLKTPFFLEMNITHTGLYKLVRNFAPFQSSRQWECQVYRSGFLG
jgi:hypothetical protein